MPYNVQPSQSPALSSSGDWMSIAQIISGLMSNGSSGGQPQSPTGNTPNADTFPGMLNGAPPSATNFADPTGTRALMYSMGQPDSPLLNSGFNISKYGVSTSAPKSDSY